MSRQQNEKLPLEEGLKRLEQARRPLFRELERLLKNPNYFRGEPPHLCCTRARNQMRITPLEAQSIARALETVPELRQKLPQIRQRTEEELKRLVDGTRRQNFQCPLLEGTKCLVHDAAKPIGCTAWNPGRDFTTAGWRAFLQRDFLNNLVYGPNWKLRVIPLWLARVLSPCPRQPWTSPGPGR
ncbi:MAG: hypothetical protein HY717_14810 [Planctomycetes bacterium]|nr:hypothetical protein [Planctomycetota bacterium]